MTQHILEKHKKCDSNYCNGGLAVCTVCHCAEGTLPTECPGEHVLYEQERRIYLGEIDFVNGAWVEGRMSRNCPPHQAVLQEELEREKKVTSIELSTSINTFSFNLLWELTMKGGNIFVSPKNVLDPLGMVYCGAAGGTATQLRIVCNFPPSYKDLGIATRLLQTNLDAQRGCTLRSVCAIWAQNGYPFSDDYKTWVRGTYLAPFKTVDYENPNNHHDIAADINTWVEDATRGEDGEGRLSGLVSASDFDRQSKLTLVSAIYFLGKWLDKFKEEDTRADSFRSPGGFTPCKMMHRVGRVDYYAREEFQAVALPYEGKDLEMVIILPTPTTDINTIERSLTSEVFSSILEDFSVKKVRLFIPKWKSNLRYDMGALLQDMGMVEAFTDRADFSGMVSSGKPDLKIGKVIHQTFVDNTEEGTEAAAATSVLVSRCLSIEAPPEVFRADRPFIYAIRHVPTNTILFLGRMERPEGY
jgi:serpin B